MSIKHSIIKRRDKRIWYLVGGVFVAVFSFTILAQKHEILNNDAGAANVSAFDPGYIISDFQMSNYDSMSESQIQSFLESKNSCWDTSLGRYTAGDKVSYFSEISPPRTWHVRDGHFVCMADEVFDGGTAAHIIYQAAQDYRINPQVLLVLLEKEQSLVTDTFPHSQQYRSATGYGCPDTAACSSEYYGLKNQIRNAAALFRTVLNGGWTNYPLGNNYVQYNPSASCGGSVVNIRNLATSALYRYTPYQPNAATLSGWSDGCNAYGNLNFYKLFEDWFGGITDEDELSGCDIFCDMPEDNLSAEAIRWMYENGITNYYSKRGEFSPDTKVDTAQLNKFLIRFQNKYPDKKVDDIDNILETVDKETPGLLSRGETALALYLLNDIPVDADETFNDLPDDYYGRLAIDWAYNNGITKYYSSPGEYAPYMQITRREVAIFLWRLAGSPDVDISNASEIFEDLSVNDELGTKAIIWAYNNGTTKYYSSPGEYAPYMQITRREVAIFLWRYEDEPLAYDSNLEDLPSNIEMANAINWAYTKGITKYYAREGEFADGVIITRRQIAIFLYRMSLLR